MANKNQAAISSAEYEITQKQCFLSSESADIKCWRLEQ